MSAADDREARQIHDMRPDQLVAMDVAQTDSDHMYRDSRSRRRA